MTTDIDKTDASWALAQTAVDSLLKKGEVTNKDGEITKRTLSGSTLAAIHGLLKSLDERGAIDRQRAAKNGALINDAPFDADDTRTMQ